MVEASITPPPLPCLSHRCPLLCTTTFRCLLHLWTPAEAYSEEEASAGPTALQALLPALQALVDASGLSTPQQAQQAQQQQQQQLLQVEGAEGSSGAAAGGEAAQQQGAAGGGGGGALAAEGAAEAAQGVRPRALLAAFHTQTGSRIAHYTASWPENTVLCPGPDHTASFLSAVQDAKACFARWARSAAAGAAGKFSPACRAVPAVFRGALGLSGWQPLELAYNAGSEDGDTRRCKPPLHLQQGASGPRTCCAGQATIPPLPSRHAPPHPAAPGAGSTPRSNLSLWSPARLRQRMPTQLLMTRRWKPCRRRWAGCRREARPRRRRAAAAAAVAVATRHLGRPLFRGVLELGEERQLGTTRHPFCLLKALMTALLKALMRC